MLLGTLMVLLLGVRPLIKAIRGDKPKQKPLSTKEAKKLAKQKAEARRRRGRSQGSRRADGRRRPARSGRHFARIRDRSEPEEIDAAMVERQVEIAQQIVETKPDSAVIALRQMLQPVNEETQAP
jgi:flagellar M-ring protein FliF